MNETSNKMHKLIALILIVLIQFIFVPVPDAHAATSPGLGSAASFAILAGTAITNVPTSVITGDVGLSPAAGTNYSGLTSPEVSGTIFAVDSSGPDGTTGSNPDLLTTAKADLVTAYNGLASGANASASCDAGYQFGSGNVDLSGASLAPGLYCADTFTLTGTLTLTGSGVWVFRSAATLITSGTANVVGGNACDIWWQVPSSATLGSNTSLKGNILALTSISMVTGASLTGRALARNGAVTLQSNTVNQSCSSAAVLPVSGPLTSAGASSGYCPPLDASVVKPTIIESRRVDSDSVFISWGPYSGANTFNVRYGTTNGNWLYNVNVTGFSTTINNLPANTPIWVEVAARNSCTIGDYGPARFVGGPGLPNAGFLPHKNVSSLYILLSMIIFSLFLLKTRHAK